MSQAPRRSHVGFQRSAELSGGYFELHATAEFSKVFIATSTISQAASPAFPALPWTPPLLRYVLSILRHATDKVGIEMDRDGLFNLEDLYERLSQARPSPTALRIYAATSTPPTASSDSISPPLDAERTTATAPPCSNELCFSRFPCPVTTPPAPSTCQAA